MIGLILKDYYSLRSYLHKQLVLMMVVYIFIGVTMKSFVFVVPMMTLYIVMMLISSFSVDDAAKWNSYALTLPVTPRMLVGAKYILFFGSLVVFSVLVSAVCALLDAFTFRETASSIFAASAAVTAVYVLVGSIMMPMFFKLGVEKARVAMTVVFMIPFLLIFWGSSWLSASYGDITPLLAGLPWAGIAAAVVILLALFLAVSYLLSVKFLDDKEF